MILVLDFGSQYTQLIARRIRESNVYCEIHPFSIAPDKIAELNPEGIILSGGPASVYQENAPKVQREILDVDVPFLGICYGMGVINLASGGDVARADHREYGPYRGPQAREPIRILQPDRPTGLKQPRTKQNHPRHRPFLSRSIASTKADSRRAILTSPPALVNTSCSDALRLIPPST